MLDWIRSDMKGDPHLIVERLDQVIHGSVDAALARLRTDKPLSNEANDKKLNTCRPGDKKFITGVFLLIEQIFIQMYAFIIKGKHTVDT